MMIRFFICVSHRMNGAIPSFCTVDLLLGGKPLEEEKRPKQATTFHWKRLENVYKMISQGFSKRKTSSENLVGVKKEFINT